jgi:hypothetical protein
MKQTKTNRKLLHLDRAHVRLLTPEQLDATPGGFYTSGTSGTQGVGCGATFSCICH